MSGPKIRFSVNMNSGLPELRFGGRNTRQPGQGLNQMVRDAVDAPKRVKAFNESLDADIDDITRQEIKSLYTGGANSTEIAKLLAAAQEGKGIYAVRKIGQNRKELMADAPGRGQVVSDPTLGKGLY